MHHPTPRLATALAVLLTLAARTPSPAQTMHLVEDRTTENGSYISTPFPYGSRAAVGAYTSGDPLHIAWVTDGTAIGTMPLNFPFVPTDWNSDHEGLVGDWLVYRSSHMNTRGLWLYNITTGQSHRVNTLIGRAAVVGNVVLFQEQTGAGTFGQAWRIEPLTSPAATPIPDGQPLPLDQSLIHSGEAFFFVREAINPLLIQRGTLWSYSLATGQSRPRTAPFTTAGLPRLVAGHIVGVEQIGTSQFAIYRLDPRTDQSDRRILTSYSYGSFESIHATNGRFWCEASVRPDTGPTRAAIYRFDPTTGSLDTLFLPNDASSPGMRSAAVISSTIYYMGRLPDGRYGFHRITEQAALPELIMDIGPATGTINLAPSVTALGGRLWIRATDSFRGEELWIHDPATRTTRLVKDINPGPASAAIHVRGSVQSGTQTIALFSANDGVHGTELWRSDGTEAGTYLLRDFQTGTNGNKPATFRPIGDRLIYGLGGYRTISRDSPSIPLFPTDVALTDTQATRATRSPSGREVVYFSGVNRTATRTGLAVTDGTPEGTLAIATPAAGAACGPSGPLAMVALNGVGVIASLSTEHLSCAPWILTPPEPERPITAQRLVATGTNEGFGSYNMVASASSAYFTLATSQFGRELWRTNGTPAGTHVIDITPGMVSSLPGEVVPTDTGACFVSAGFLGPGGVYKIDWPSGTAQPSMTQLVQLPRATAASRLAFTATKVVFATTFDQPLALWSVDTQSLELRRVSEIIPLDYMSVPPGTEPYAKVGGRLCFLAAPERESMAHLYAYDPDLGVVQQLASGSASYDSQWQPTFLTPLHNHLLFAMNDGIHGQELWITDGTPDGTRLWLDAVPGPASSSPTEAALVEGILYLAASTPECGGELYGIRLCGGDLNLDFTLGLDDLLLFLTAFEKGDLLADLDDDGSGQPHPDGAVTIDDLLYMLARFEAGC